MQPRAHRWPRGGFARASCEWEMGRCLAGKPGECPSPSCWCKWWAKCWVCPHLSWPQQPAPGRAAAPVRDLIAAGKDTPLRRGAALPRHCQALGRAPAVWAGARYPPAGTHTALERETQSRQPHSLQTPRETSLEMLLGRVHWRHLCCCERFAPLKGYTCRV